jgi:L-ascorbate metabolism protein UlaG (beta-lactamase superfamily)
MRRLVFLLGVAIPFALTLTITSTLTGCGGRGDIAPASAQRFTRIQWLGHKSFRITSGIGTTILTNPYAGRMGGRALPSPLKSDIVLITAERPDSNNINAIDNQPAIVRGGVGIGVNSITGIPIRGIPSYRNPEIPSSDGMNLAYTWVMDGVRFCFAGHLARPLDGEQLAQIGTVDVLFLPVDTLSASAREQVVAQLRPKLVIPIGQGARGWSVGEVLTAPADGLMLSRQMLPQQTATLFLAQ